MNLTRLYRDPNGITPQEPPPAAALPTMAEAQAMAADRRRQGLPPERTLTTAGWYVPTDMAAIRYLGGPAHV